MPRKAAAPKSTGATDEAKPEGARRSTRIAEKPVSTSAPAPAKKAAAKPKGKRAAEKDDEHEEAEPAPKKAKPVSKAVAAEETAATAEDAAEPSIAEPAVVEPAVEAEAEAAPKPVSKPASKAASTAAKPASKASAAKPSSKAASTSKPASKKSTRGHASTAAAAEPAITEEDEEKAVSEQMEVEDKENHKEEVKAAAAEAEAEAEVGELQIGDGLPEWTFQNEKGEDIEIAKLAGEKGLVLFLVPKADTPGCTTQACGFRDSYEDFEKYGYAIYGLSADTPVAQAKWQTKKNLQYSLISDPKRKLIHALGAKTGSSTKRSHLVFEKGSGKLIEKKIGVKPADSPKHALEFIKKHHPNDA
ncbi:hypothetical protein FRB97_005599 [Tulasnella sp. 331]|nr:hypothetical protein FRB97_005599 [Tulasnella sp. 331]KAG8889244.1 hypothetical protein FRB98_005256 [Tulasnella sp. 332]